MWSWASIIYMYVDDAALAVYRANHTHEARHIDLADTARAVEAIRGRVERVDLLCASPPCTDFSCAGARVERASHAGLTVAAARIAAALRPRCVVLENVPEMLRSRAWAEASAVLADAGYAWAAVRVNAAACGVAQAPGGAKRSTMVSMAFIAVLQKDSR